MKPTTEILVNISKNSAEHEDEVFTKLFRYMLRPDIYHEAFKKMRDKGKTEADNDDTDGLDEEIIQKIIQSLKDGSYQPRPAIGKYITDKKGKKRLVNTQSFQDKLVQEVLKMILEAVYEPVFSDCSHGFRPHRSCHTALKSVKNEFTGAIWFIKGDMDHCFDNIDQHVLVNIINRKIRDERLTQLIWKFLRAGYMDNWQYHKTYSGCPQGGILSPLLANIYLNEFDRFVAKLADEYHKPRDRVTTKEYADLGYEIRKAKKKAEISSGQEKVDSLKKIKVLKKQLKKTPYASRTDKVLKYVRYADDFLIGVKGDKADCEKIMQKISSFLKEDLKLDMSEEKTGIVHSSNYIRFLGYDIRVRRDDTLKPHGDHLMRTLNMKVELCIPFQDKIIPFLFERSIAKQTKNGTIEPTARKYLYSCTDIEIVMTFNAELKGICCYYALASDYHKLCFMAYLMEYSCLKTIAGKHETTARKIIAKYAHDGKWRIPYKTKTGTNYMTIKDFMKYKKDAHCDDVIGNPAVTAALSRNPFDKRILGGTCEICGKTGVPTELHHINRLKNLKDKPIWAARAIAKKRKTIEVCKDCHHLVQNP